MKKRYLLPVFPVLTLCILCFPIGTGFALDEGGCLTCHQYPGLVRPVEPDGFKALHIDEATYFSSPHGKIRCNKCHTPVVKIPHTGAKAVDCTTDCHRGGKERKIPDDFVLEGFHIKEQSFIARLEDDSSCRVCHPLYPHSKDNHVRALLNMHTGFMLCEVCHIRRDKHPNLTYEWESTGSVTFSGKPFGSYFNPRLGKTQTTDDVLSRIVPFAVEKTGKRLLMNTWDTAEAKAFARRQEALKPEEKKEQLDNFHSDTAKKEISVACNECHSQTGILDFEALGFGEKKTKDLIYINIKGLVTKYRTFYLPKLFGE